MSAEIALTRVSFPEYVARFKRMTPDERIAYELERKIDVAAKLKANREENRRLRLQYELGDDYADVALETHRETPGNAKAMQLAHRIVDGVFSEGCAFWGVEFGNGKTRLAACLAHAAISRDISARFITMANVLKLVQASFKSQEAKDKVASLTRVRFLAIDEIDKPYLGESGWGSHEMFDLLNERSANGLKLYVTSNRSHRELNDFFGQSTRSADPLLIGATMDRLLGMTGGPQNWVEVTGQSERWS